jgi:hypothetical protein
MDLHEDHASRLYGPVFAAHRHGRATLDHVIHLVLGVRLLGVGAVGRQHIQAHAKGRHPQELKIIAARALPFFDQLRYFKSVHASHYTRRPVLIEYTQANDLKL